MILALLYAPLGALTNRVRGGFLPTGHTQLARGIYAVAFAVMLALPTLNWRLALAAVPALFLGAILGSNDWGLLRDWTEAREAILSGVLNVAPVALAVFFLAQHPVAASGYLLAAGLAKLPLYYLAVKVIRSPVRYLAGGELGEALYGAALGLAIGGAAL